MGLEVRVNANHLIRMFLLILLYVYLIVYHILAAFCTCACVPQVNWIDRALPHTLNGFHIFFSAIAYYSSGYNLKEVISYSLSGAKSNMHFLFIKP